MGLSKLLQAFNFGRNFTNVETQVIQRLNSPIWDRYKFLYEVEVLGRKNYHFQKGEILIKNNGSFCIKSGFYLGRLSKPIDYIFSKSEIERYKKELLK